MVLVNDGSPDNSADVCRRLASRTDIPVTFLNLSRNFGEHNAVMAGLSARARRLRHHHGRRPAESDFRGGQALRARAAPASWDVVYTYYAEKKHAAWRNLGSRFANRVADVLLDKPRGLYLSSFRCMSAFVARSITLYEGPFPYVDGLILQATQHIDRIPVEHVARATGQSNYTLRRLIRLWLNLFVNFSAMPLRVSVVAGFVIGLLGLIGFIAVILEALFRAPPPGWASLMAGPCCSPAYRW